MIIKQLIANLAILVSILFLYSQVYNVTPLEQHSPVKRKILSGIFGGLLGNVLMWFSIPIGTTIIDLRHIPILILAFFGGALPAIICMFVIILGRFIIGINISAYASIIFVGAVTLFSVLISKSTISKKSKVFLMLTISNIIFSIVVYYLIVDKTLFVSLNVTYWVISYLSGFISFSILKYIQDSQVLFQKYKVQSTTDGLTGLNNVRKFDEVFHQLVSDLQTNNQYLSLLYLDIDNFKKINDTYGHANGDLVLKKLGEIIKKTARSFDVVSRNGGEEFTVILLDCRLERAIEIAEELRSNVENHSFLIGNSKQLDVTISVGVASYKDTTENPKDLIDDADKALYHAKNNGRNKVSFFSL